MRQLENDRTIARLDDRRDERVASIGERRLGTNPARCDRPRGPQHDNRFRVPQPLLDHLVEGFAGVKRGVPPGYVKPSSINASAKTWAMGRSARA